MEKDEIDEWNRKLSGGKLLPLSSDKQQQQQQQQQGVEVQRALALAAIQQTAEREEAAEKLQQQQQQQQSWISRVFDLSDKKENTKAKKASLLFDK
ncbi:hypothetical protein, conserved [Eimeria brunetti]|uniref:Uncharacterized protein n=1 Tax=Eimeria brunetti TaxID=51314 RepID=U6LMN0_9EIME|nr:hypothetical protein, conserved [Eimeria brunetti]